jgi:hypothetical protein
MLMLKRNQTDFVEKNVIEESKAFECEICTKRFKWTQAPGGHSKAHFHTNNRKNYNNFPLHTKKLNHSDKSINIVACDVCTKDFPSKLSLSWYKRRDHPSKELHVKEKLNDSGLTKYLPPGWLRIGKRGRGDNF